MLVLLVSTWATYDIGLGLPKIAGMVVVLWVFFAFVREGCWPSGWWLGLLFFLVVGVGIAGLGLLGTQ